MCTDLVRDVVLVHAVKNLAAALRRSTGNWEEAGCCSLDPGALPGQVSSR